MNQVIDTRPPFAMVYKDALEIMVASKIVTSAGIAIYVALSLRASRDSHSCFPSLDTIAKDAGVSRDTASKQVLALEEEGLITIERRRNTNGQSTSLYTIVSQPMPKNSAGRVGKSDSPESENPTNQSLKTRHELEPLELEPLELDIPVSDSGESSTELAPTISETPHDLNSWPVSSVGIPAGEGAGELAPIEPMAPPTNDPFEEFWAAYPRSANPGRHNKKAARASFQKALKKVSAAKIMAALEWFKNQHDWRKDNGQYIPGAHVWLNQERWTSAEEATAPNRWQAESGYVLRSPAPTPIPAQKPDFSNWDSLLPTMIAHRDEQRRREWEASHE